MLLRKRLKNFPIPSNHHNRRTHIHRIPRGTGHRYRLFHCSGTSGILFRVYGWGNGWRCVPGLVIDEWPHTGNFKVRLGDISTLNYWSSLVYRVGVTNPQDVVIALLIDVDDDGSWDDFLIGEPYHYETGNGSGYTP